MQNTSESDSVIRQRVADFRTRILAARRDFERRHATKPESETSGIIQDLFRDLGYRYLDGMATEYKVRGIMDRDDACDIALAAEPGPVKKPSVFVEVKAYSKSISKAHRDQVCKYASRSRVTWAVVTNGICWEVYRVVSSKSKGVEPRLEFNVDLSDGISDDALAVFSALHRSHLRGNSFEELADRNARFTPENLSALILRPESIQCLVGLMRDVHHVNVSESDLRTMLAERVIGRCVDIPASDLRQEPKPVAPEQRPCDPDAGRAAPAPSTPPSAPSRGDCEEFTFTAKGITARCRKTSGGFTVFAGQPIVPELVPSSVGKAQDNVRRQLAADGTIADSRFVRDYTFKSMSAAAGCILGRSVNGNAVWKPAN